ncbi:hypothetical protein [Sphingosinicella sp. LY1275]|uniref:hypothetical protein n=1 Tax=Sphingosinicella sp. LY1275 TaxID=3095379 RepID=UPI002ADEE927|nr:hypothetical protein [Sphingosinicella sp. LY1275]MEA1015037.1 hypothetical protein [Sphingosinicella sp. LY1275]
MANDPSSACPLAAVDRRLEDAHRQWHEAEAAYFEPDDFRRAIQTTIQTLRTVTFLLQSNKARIPDFQSWYQEWQDRLRADPLMRWMVDARNRIEKQGDLEVHSFVRAEVIASHLNEGPRLEVPAKLFDGASALLDGIPQDAVSKHVREHGTLAIQRRWVENTLPDHELLEAVATAYGRLTELVASAHEQMGLPPPTTTNSETHEVFRQGDRAGRLPCMIGHSEARTLNISLADGARLTVVSHHIPLDDERAKAVAESFPVEPDEVFAGNGASLEDQLTSLFATARKVFAADGYHDTIVFMFADLALVDIRQLSPEEHGQKYLIMRSLANDVVRKGADAVILLTEMWFAPFDPQKPYQRAADAPNRREMLAATLVRKQGEPIELWAEIHREKDEVSVGETIQADEVVLYAFAPVYEAWGRAIPSGGQTPFSTPDGAEER